MILLILFIFIAVEMPSSKRFFCQIVYFLQIVCVCEHAQIDGLSTQLNVRKIVAP